LRTLKIMRFAIDENETKKILPPPGRSYSEKICHLQTANTFVCLTLFSPRHY
jgi:hypothetical protein